jgi:hypothetical protein
VIDICCPCGDADGVEVQVLEEVVHVDAEGFVVAVDGCPSGGSAALSEAAVAGEDWRDDFVA